MSGLFLGTCLSNFKSVALTVLELLAFNTQKFRGHVTVATPLSQKILRGHAWTFPGIMLVKFEVRCFNLFGAIIIYRTKIYGVTLPWPYPLFEKFLSDHVWTVPGNMLVKFDVRLSSFNRFKLV